MMKKILTLIIMVLVLNVYAQEANNDELLSNSTSIRSLDLRSKKLVGSNYINDEYLPAKIFGRNKIHSVRFDAYQDEMEVISGSEARYLM